MNKNLWKYYCYVIAKSIYKNAFLLDLKFVKNLLILRFKKTFFNSLKQSYFKKGITSLITFDPRKAFYNLNILIKYNSFF